MEELGVGQVFIDRMSGKSTDRPELKRMMNFVREGDVVMVESISRFARNTRDLLDLVEKHNKKIFALVSNMSIAVKRRDFLQKFDCFICNQQEAGILFLDDYEDKTPEEMRDILAERIVAAAQGLEE